MTRDGVDPIPITAPATLAEGPVWDERTERLIWVDILAGEIHELDPSTGNDTRRSIGVPVGAVALRRDGGLVLAAGSGFALLEPDAEDPQWIWQDGVGGRMNDGRCDPAGRFVAGTMTDGGRSPDAALYRLDSDLTVHTIMTGISLSNGLAWNAERNLLYYVDTPTERIDVCDYDLDTGVPSGRRAFVDLHDIPGRPDGLTLDSDGGVWVALAGGGTVRRFDQHGRPDHVVSIPARKVTSMAFGGRKLDEMFVTTSREGYGAAEIAADPLAGCVFTADCGGARGVIVDRFAR